MRTFYDKNRDYRNLFFLMFFLWVKDLECRFGFLLKNLIHSQLEMSKIPKFVSKKRNSQTLGQKSLTSYHMPAL